MTYLPKELLFVVLLVASTTFRCAPVYQEPAVVYVRPMETAEGTLYITNSQDRVRREALHYGFAAPRGYQVSGFWHHWEKVGWSLDKPDVIAHERCHMLGYTHEEMARYQAQGGTGPCPAETKAAR